MGRKSYLLVVNCKPIKVPIRPELSIQECYADAIQIPGVADHFPDEWEGARRVDRKFFWLVLASLHPEYVKHLIRGSRQARQAHQAERVIQPTLLQPQTEWINNLLADEGFVAARK